jgi:hypothetical protein
MKYFKVKKKSETISVWGWEPVGKGRVKGEGEGRVNMIKIVYTHV